MSELRDEAKYEPKVSEGDLPDQWDRAAKAIDRVADTRELRELWCDANQKIPGADNARSILWGKIPAMIVEIERLKKENAKMVRMVKKERRA
jgi:hypothetical protein